jgi:ribosomal protein S18 acetylase RimI-like enzyme
MSEFPSITQIEAAALSAWPAISTALDGLWLARFARGYTKRSNSVQCLDVTDDGDAPARLQRLVDLYLLNDLPPIFRVTPLAGPGVIAALDAESWAPFGETRVLAMSLGDRHFDVPDNCRVSDATDPNWIEGLGALIGANPRDLGTLTQILNLIALRAAGILIRDQAGDPVAAAMAVNANGIGVFHNVVTRVDARGQGYGRAAMNAALNWTREAGATHAALQVVSDNAPAVNLYGSLGFTEAYRYHYRSPSGTEAN